MRERTIFTNSEIPGRIAQYRPFLSDGKLPDGTRRWSGYRLGDPARPHGMGHLPSRFYREVRRAWYVVYSYGTPIAWVASDYGHNTADRGTHWIPDIGYSPTTGVHQLECMEAWADEMRAQGDYRRWPASGREVVRVPGNAIVYGEERRLRTGGMDGAIPTYPRSGSAYDVGGDGEDDRDVTHMGGGLRRPDGFGRTADGWRSPSHP